MSKCSEIHDRDLALPLDIESERWARLSIGVLRLVCLVFVFLTLIAAFAPIREVAIANGQLVTAQPSVVIEHLDGGLVEEILVVQGQLVEEETPILQLSRGKVESELLQIRSRQTHIHLQRERLLALVEQRRPNFSEWEETYANLVSEQMALFVAEHATVSASTSSMQLELQELRQEYDAAKRQESSLVAQFNHASSQSQLQTKLAKSGLSTQSRALDAMREVERIRAEIAAANRDALAALRVIGETRRIEMRESADRLQKWTETITQLSADIAELRETEKQKLAAHDRLLVASPVKGYIQELEVGGIGEVVGPGDRLVTIVPAESPLMAEVRIKPSDIGFVEAGSFADISVTTFEQEVFGSISGEVIFVSPTAFQNGEDEPYFVAKLVLDRFVGKGGNPTKELGPGMVVHANIRTGQKSILRYMLKPLARAWDLAFAER